MNLPSGLPDLVEGKEPLARFLTQSSHFSSNGVKKDAFLPNPKDGELSVFRVAELKPDEIEKLGRTRLPKLYGVAQLAAGDVQETGLRVEAAEPPDRHANIVGWSWNAHDREFGKAARMEKAIILAQRSELCRYAPTVC